MVVAQAVELGATTAYLALLDEAGGELSLVAHANLGENLAARLGRVRLDAPALCARAARTREPAVVEDVARIDPELSLTREILRASRAGSALALPLATSDRLVGVLTLTLRDPHRSTAAELDALLALGRMFAVAIANTQGAAFRLRAIFDHTFQLIGLLSPDGTLLEANRSALEVTGLRREELVGRPFSELPWWSDSADKKRKLEDAIRRAAQGEFVRFETEHVAHDGRQVAVDFSLSPVKDAAGKVVLLVPEGRDVTERRELERLREEWTDIVAHDIKQPINAIFLWLKLLARQRAELGERAATAVDHIASSLDQLTRLTDDLLDFSRIESGRLELRRAPTELGELVSGAAELLGPERQIAFEPHGDAIFVEVDAPRLERALSGLLAHANEHAHPAQPIAVTLGRGADAVELTIAFESRTIGQAELERQLGRIRHAAPEAGQTKPGLGLGPYIARILVEAHGGSIRVEAGAGNEVVLRVSLPHC